MASPPGPQPENGAQVAVIPCTAPRELCAPGGVCCGCWHLVNQLQLWCPCTLSPTPRSPQGQHHRAAALQHFSPTGFKGSGKADCYPSPSSSRRAKTKLKLQVWVQGMSSWERVFLPHCWAELLGGAARRRMSTRGWGPGVCCPQPRPPTKCC